MAPRISSFTHPRRAHAMLVAGAVFVLGVAAGATLAPERDRAFLHPPLPAAPAPGRSFPADVLRVFDGDTFLARVRLGDGQVITTKVRLRGIDAPERDARCAEEAVQAETARRRLQRILAEGRVSISQLGPDRYGRVLALVATGATPDVSEALLHAGVVRRYDGGYRAGWCGRTARDWNARGAAVMR